jgi:hypothetical protein
VIPTHSLTAACMTVRPPAGTPLSPALSALSGALSALPVPSGTSQLPAVLTALDNASPIVAVLLTVYLVARLLIPAILIVYTTRDASAKKRIALLRSFLLTSTRRDRRRPR